MAQESHQGDAPLFSPEEIEQNGYKVVPEFTGFLSNAKLITGKMGEKIHFHPELQEAIYEGTVVGINKDGHVVVKDYKKEE